MKQPFDFTGWTNWAPEVRFLATSMIEHNSDWGLRDADYTTAGKWIRLRGVYMPVHGGTFSGRGIIQFLAAGYALLAPANDMGNRESKASR